MLDKDYFESEHRYNLITGEEVHTRHYPSKMSAYGLAKALNAGYAGRRDIYQAFLGEKFLGTIRQTLDLQSLQKRKPTQEEKATYRKRFAAFNTIFQTNLPRIIKSILKNDREPKLSVPYWEKNEYGGALVQPEPEEEQVNRLIFNIHMQRAIASLAHHPGVLRAIEDYVLVQEVLEDQSRFSELEIMCSYNLWYFVNELGIRRLDKADQYQEGLITIWNCAKTYRGKNFARFPTMVKTALKNKHIDLLRYSLADKRRLNRVAQSIGSVGGDDTEFTHQVDDLTHSAWRLAQQDQMVNGKDYNPFHTIPPVEWFWRSLDRGEWVTEFRDTHSYEARREKIHFEEADETNFPAEMERKLKVIELK